MIKKWNDKAIIKFEVYTINHKIVKSFTLGCERSDVKWLISYIEKQYPRNMVMSEISR